MKNQTNYIFSHVVLKGSFFEEENGFTDVFFKGDVKVNIKLIKKVNIKTVNYVKVII